MWAQHYNNYCTVPYSLVYMMKIISFPGAHDTIHGSQLIVFYLNILLSNFIFIVDFFYLIT